ncbi:MAG TPA: hypothetical protein PKZ76_09970 [Xanthomonadaceae bacterium]|nr:hypothetical protein [Xanthomonadaceae bacterium]
MGLLEDLEKEAERRRAGDDEAQHEREERERRYREVCEPAMQALAEYLARLFKQVESLKTQTRVSVELPGYGMVVAETEPEYQLRQTREAGGFRLEVSGAAQVLGEECPLVQVDGVTKVKAMNRLFQQCRLGGMQPLAKDDVGEVSSASFRARGRIDMSGEIVASADAAQVRLNFTNFDGFASITRSFAPERFSEEFFDGLGRYLLCQSPDALRESLPDDMRSQIKARLAQQEMRKRWEEKLGERQRAEYRALARAQGPLGQIRHELGSLGGRLLGLFRRAERE